MDKNTVYILQKDLPYVKAGVEYKFDGEHYVCDETSKFTTDIYSDRLHKKSVENNIEWFKPKEEVNESKPTEQFQWTEELTKELLEFGKKYKYFDEFSDIANVLNDFKQSKSKKEEPQQEWWQKMGIKFDGKWYTHPATNTYDNLAQVLVELREYLKYAPHCKNYTTDIPVTNVKEEPQWEILAYNNPNVFTDVLGGNIVDAKGSGANYAILKNFPIHSVKRFPDNTVWSVDMVTNKGRITGFHIEKGIMVAEFENNTRHCDLMLLIKAPKEEQRVGEDMICPVTKKHCDDECCPVGAECNLSSDDIEDCEKPSPKEEQVPIKVEWFERINPFSDYYWYQFRTNQIIPNEKSQYVKSSIEDVINNKYKPWKMYQTGFTSEELLQARRDAFLEARKYINNYGGLGNYESLKFTSVEDYINSLK